MAEIDFSICSFIKEELNFLTYHDFCKNAKIIKAYYDVLEKNEKIFYKWYVYANIHMDEGFKNLIWTYLNSTEQEDYDNLIENEKKYKVR